MFAASKTASVSGGYQISRSLRFNSADSAYLNRTPASASNQKTWTWSGWVKRSTLGNYNTFFNAGGNGFVARFNNPTDYLEVYNYSGGYQLQLITAQVFRDVSAWYHIVIALDTTPAEYTARCKLYVNGVQVTSFYGTPAYPNQNADLLVNAVNVHTIGNTNGIGAYNDGLLTEVNFIDGQALTPSSFGETNAQTGVWQPKAYSGSYGTNGFYLNFSDNSNTTAATLGKDYSGNGNNWTPNNFSVTAGSGNDSLVDSPTSYGTDTGAGGTVRGNYATLNPLVVFGTSTFTNGNLDVSVSSLNTNILATIAIPTSGKWYWEYQITSIGGGGSPMGGIASTSSNSPAIFYRSNGDKLVDGTSSAYGATYTTTDIVGVAVNTDGGTITFYKNGSSQGAVTYATSSGSFFPALRSNAATDTFTVNFGQRAFANTAPSGFKALCTQNLPTPTIGATSTTQAGKYFGATAYTGTSATQAIVNDGFQPDLIWLKSRNAIGDNGLYDSIRGISLRLVANNTNAEASVPLDSFNSNGFSITSNYNNSGQTLIAWQWKAGGTGSTNTAGQITSTVSANTTSGFSIVTFTTDGTTKTVGHGLGVKPSLVIVKVRNGAGSWIVMTDIINGSMQYGALNSTAAFASIGYSAPTSTVFQYNDNNGNTQVAYCFAPIAGYSAFGSYTGNGSADGPFVYTGFRPAYVMVKRTNTSGTSWNIFDTTRSPYNVTDDVLFADLSNAEVVNESTAAFDILSNGFKLRTTGTSMNGSGDTYIYMAFASSPFKFSLAR